jgi:hypothetical protein
MDLGFWIGIIVGVLLLFARTWIGAAFTRRARPDDWAENQDRPIVPGPPNDWLNDNT